MAESSWEALLWSFLAVDNVTRNAAEAHFAILKQASCSDELLLGLVHVIHSTSPDDIRALAAVLLRRVLLRDTVSLWPRATEQARHIIKKELVAILAAGEKNRSIRRKVCDTVGELASSILEDGQWDSLFPTLLQWSKASIVFLREAALRILEMIAVVLASQISQSTLETIGTSSLHSIVLDILSKGLQDREGRVAMNSLRALSMVLLHLDALEQSFRPEILTAVVVPSLQQILYNCLEESVHVTKNSTNGLKPLPTVCSSATLGGIALECLSLIGQAVGKHVFARDAASILKVMAEMQATPSIVNNELIRTYLLQAWARCCTCLGQDFAPYLPLVMPTLLEAATQQAEFEVDPSRLASDDEDEELTDSEDTQLAHVNGKCLSIRTSILEDKATACQLLAGMVTDLEDAFFPYAEQATQLLAPLLTESVHSDIRAAAIYAMPALVKCVAISTATCLNKGSVAMRQMLDFVLGRLVNALKSEPDVELVIRIMQSMIQCLNDTQDLHPLLLLNEAQLQEVVHGILVILGDSFQRRAMRRSLHSSDFNDDDDTNVQVDAMQDMETELHFVLAECIGTLAKTHRSAFFPVFQSLLWDKVAALAARDCLREDRQLALFVIDDVLEYCGKPAWRLLDVFVPVLQSALQEIMEPDLIQAAAFGVGICASHGGDAFTPYAKQCLKLLDPIVTHPNAQKQTRRNATDNAVAALGKLCEYHAEAVDASKLFPQWLALLPLRGDLEESFAVCHRLCGYIQDSHTLVLGGREYLHVDKVVAVLAAYAEENFSQQLSQSVGEAQVVNLRLELASCLATLRGSVPEKVINYAWTSLSIAQQTALQALLPKVF